jgi:hypothetical protein
MKGGGVKIASAVKIVCQKEKKSCLQIFNI